MNETQFVFAKECIEKSRKYFDNGVYLAWWDDSMNAVIQHGEGSSARIAGYWSNTEWRPFLLHQDASTVGIPDADMWGKKIRPTWLVFSGDYGLMPDFHDKTDFTVTAGCTHNKE